MKKQAAFMTQALTMAISTQSMATTDLARRTEVPGAEKSQVARNWAAGDMTTVHFIKGGSALTEAERLNLKALYQKTLRINPIARVVVLTWADKETVPNDRASESQLALAQKRGEVLKQTPSEMSQKPVEVYIMTASDIPIEFNEAVLSTGGLGRAVVMLERVKNNGGKAAGL